MSEPNDYMIGADDRPASTPLRAEAEALLEHKQHYHPNGLWWDKTLTDCVAGCLYIDRLRAVLARYLAGER